MIRHFIFSKVAEKVIGKVLQGDTHGLKKYIKYGVAALIIGGVLLFVILMIFVWSIIATIGGLLTHINPEVYTIDPATKERVVEKINEAQAITPNSVTETALEIKDAVAPYSQMLNDGVQMIEGAKETFNRIESLLP